MPKKVFFFPIETASRELDYKLLLACNLALKGCVIFIGNKAQITKFGSKLSSINYLDKGYHLHSSDNLYRAIKKKGGKVFSLDEEGAVDFKNKNVLASRYSLNLFKNVDKIFFWGKSQHREYKHLSVSDNQCLVTGHPRFDMLKKKYRSIFSERAKKIKKIHGDFILFNTNTSFGNNIRGDNFVKDNYRERFGQIDEIISQDKVKLERLIEDAKYLHDNSNLRVIIRPHPEEKNETYLEKLSKYKNVNICKDGNVVPWILASKAVVHSDCTTAIETVMLDKEAISSLPLELNEELLCPLPINLSHKSNNSITTKKIIDDLIAKKIPALNTKSDLDNFFNFFNDSTALITNSLFEESLNSENTNNLGFFYQSLKEKIRPVFIKNQDRLILEKTRGLDYYNFKDKFENIIRFLQNNEKNKISLKKIANGFYKISAL